MGLDLAISFDTTGSMSQCIRQVRSRVSEVVGRLYRDIDGLRIGVISHGDYCDAPHTIDILDFTMDRSTVEEFVRESSDTHGGDADECYELVLNRARGLNWQAGNSKILVVIGDSNPHGPTYGMNTRNLNWRNELQLLLEAGVHIHGVHCMPGVRTHSRPFYEEIARRTGGFYLTLDQFPAVVDLIYAVAYEQAGGTRLVDFRMEVQDSGRMSRNMASVFSTLTGESVSVSEHSGLQPVPPGRFQVLNVNERASISEFVNGNGLEFRKGRGFYELSKAETIQERKEVVLVENGTGDMYTGSEARNMVGVPSGTRMRIRPVDLDGYGVFVQSTSYNRILVPGTRFLYEAMEM